MDMFNRKKNVIIMGITIILSSLWWSCDTPILPVMESIPEINNVFMDFDASSGELFFQVEAGDPQGIENIDSLWIIMQSLTDNSEVLIELNDGTDGDLIQNNGIFSGILSIISNGLEFTDYLITIYVLDVEGNLAEDAFYYELEESFPPTIIEVSIPETITLNTVEEVDLEITVLVEDENGLDDIKWVRYYIDTDAMFLDNPSTNECDRDWGMTNSGYVSDPSWYMNYKGTNSSGQFEFQTIIPMRPISECGGTGDAFFKFAVKDMDNQIHEYSDIWLGIIGCGDGLCSYGFETADSCSEDCP